MSNAVISSIGQVNSAGDANALFLKVFSNEVLSTFARENQMLGMTTVRNISSGKSAQFPVTGTVSASYHTAGNEILGQAIKHNEKVINIDDMLIADAFVAEIEELKNHYDVRSIYSKEMGQALANRVDKHLLSLALLASRVATATLLLCDERLRWHAAANTFIAFCIKTACEEQGIGLVPAISMGEVMD